MSECGANGRFSIVALTRRIVMRSDIELQSVLRYRRINSRCANGEVHIVRLGGDGAGYMVPYRAAASDAREKQGPYRRARLNTRLGTCKGADANYVQTESDLHVDKRT